MFMVLSDAVTRLIGAELSICIDVLIKHGHNDRKINLYCGYMNLNLEVKN